MHFIIITVLLYAIPTKRGSGDDDTIVDAPCKRPSYEEKEEEEEEKKAEYKKEVTNQDLVHLLNGLSISSPSNSIPNSSSMIQAQATQALNNIQLKLHGIVSEDRVDIVSLIELKTTLKRLDNMPNIGTDNVNRKTQLNEEVKIVTKIFTNMDPLVILIDIKRRLDYVKSSSLHQKAAMKDQIEVIREVLSQLNRKYDSNPNIQTFANRLLLIANECIANK
eukprot:NODE_462_length_7167_cov_0.402518.p6 type:complete len:221 gc:universal NODE_462_length_7167_cov_0.402518:3060-2398(-)